MRTKTKYIYFLLQVTISHHSSPPSFVPWSFISMGCINGTPPLWFPVGFSTEMHQQVISGQKEREMAEFISPACGSGQSLCSSPSPIKQTISTAAVPDLHSAVATHPDAAITLFLWESTSSPYPFSPAMVAAPQSVQPQNFTTLYWFPLTLPHLCYQSLTKLSPITLIVPSVYCRTLTMAHIAYIYFFYLGTLDLEDTQAVLLEFESISLSASSSGCQRIQLPQTLIS